MPTKTSPPARRRAATTTKKPLAIVVRRGASRRFKALKSETAELPVVVTWDRRKTERRAEPNPTVAMLRERRADDRRQKPPYTWDVADFVVVAPPAAEVQRKSVKRR